VPRLFDWSRLPPALDAVRAVELIDTLLELGPFGFLGPAADWIPKHLTASSGTLRFVSAGYCCRSNVFVERAMDIARTHLLHVMPLPEEVEPSITDSLFIQSDDATTYAAYTNGVPTVVDLTTLHPNADRPTLRVVQHGSLHIDHLRPILDSLGLGVEPALAAAVGSAGVLAA
jgi:hypothetical protein